MKFRGRGYYREALVLKYTPGVWHLQFRRGVHEFAIRSAGGEHVAGQTAERSAERAATRINTLQVSSPGPGNDQVLCTDGRDVSMLV